MDGNWKAVEEKISIYLGRPIKIKTSESIFGGCINESKKITDSEDNQWFIKINKPSLRAMFDAELSGLNEIQNSQSIKTPSAIASGKTNQYSFLVLEHLPLSSTINQAQTGIQLAQMHQSISNNFGWHRNNTTGTTEQSNKTHDSWVNFWREERLVFQLELALHKGYSTKAYESGLMLAETLSVFFSTYTPTASLLHGDLWSGNCGTDENNVPVIFDPAVYYGDRETDIAMTELFGGFNSEFYATYDNTFPLDNGYSTRKTLYNLYHILNHFNLFGGGYASQAENMTQSLLSET